MSLWNNVSLISFLVCLSLDYRKATDFEYYFFILNMFINSRNFLVPSLVSCVCNHTIFKQGYLNCFPIWMSFIPYTYLIVVTKTARTTLNRKGENEYLYLFPHLELAIPGEQLWCLDRLNGQGTERKCEYPTWMSGSHMVARMSLVGIGLGYESQREEKRV